MGIQRVMERMLRDIIEVVRIVQKLITILQKVIVIPILVKEAITIHIKIVIVKTQILAQLVIKNTAIRVILFASAVPAFVGMLKKLNVEYVFFQRQYHCIKEQQRKSIQPLKRNILSF